MIAITSLPYCVVVDSARTLERILLLLLMVDSQMMNQISCMLVSDLVFFDSSPILSPHSIPPFLCPLFPQVILHLFFHPFSHDLDSPLVVDIYLPSLYTRELSSVPTQFKSSLIIKVAVSVDNW